MAVEEAANFIVPLVTSVAGLFLTVEVAVSKVLAVKYVPPYSKQTRPNGFEKMRLCGLVKNAMADAFREFLREFWPEAFCMIALSMTAMTGATIPAARKPAVKSDAKRNPKFLVFHTLG